MNSLLVYDSKYGSCHEIMNSIQSKLQYSKIISLADVSKVDLTTYDCVIIGSPIYAGKIRKKVISFINDYKNELLNKKIVLITCSTSSYEAALNQLKKAYDQDLVETALFIESFKGKVNFNKMNFFEKIIMKNIAKKNPDMLIEKDEENQNKVDELINKLTNL